MSHDDSPDAPPAPIELAGHHRVLIRRGDAADTVELLGRDGKLVFAIEVSERGPVLRFEGPRPDPPRRRRARARGPGHLAAGRRAAQPRGRRRPAHHRRRQPAQQRPRLFDDGRR
jgi:hypothetical protein